MNKACFSLLLTLALLVGCAHTLTPGETLAKTVNDAKTACNQACNGVMSTINITLPANAVFYATETGVCGRLGNRLFCGACSCSTPSANITTNTTCTFQPNGTSAIIECQ